MIPALIALMCLGVMTLFGLLAANTSPGTTQECIARIANGHSRERWQAAHALVELMADRKKSGVASELLDKQLAAQMIELFRDLGRDGVGRTKDEELTRRFLAVALGHLGHPDAIDALRDAAHGQKLPGAAANVRAQAIETRIYATFALARIGDPVVVPDLLTLAQDSDADMRKMAVYALGSLALPNDATATTALRRALGDSVLDVRWNAALALARRGDAEALPTVTQLCDRDFLSTIATMTGDQRSFALQNGVRAARGLGSPALKTRVEALADDDPDERVRREARAALARWGQPIDRDGRDGRGVAPEPAGS